MLHEQNAVMGRGNRLLAPFATLIAGGFLDPAGANRKIVQTGNPLREAVLEAAAIPFEPPVPEGPFRLLVFGGSQGAQFFAEVVPAALAMLAPERRGALRLTLQAREEDGERARTKLREAGIEAEVSPFFADMAARIASAHLVIARSGASTVSEIAAIGRPSILVPYPHALDHDQAANAALLAETGGAEIVAQGNLAPASLAFRIEAAMASPERLAAQAAAARGAGRPEAARLLGDLVEAMARGEDVTALRRIAEERPQP